MKKDPPVRAITAVELLSALGSVRRARKTLSPYTAGLFSQSDHQLERIDVCLTEAQLLLEETAPKNTNHREG